MTDAAGLPINPDGSALHALRDSLSEQNGYVTGFLAIGTYVDGDGSSAYSIMVDGNQSIPLTFGLAKMLAAAIDLMVDSSL